MAHKTALFGHLQERWRDLFNAKFEVLHCDLTSTYFESDPPKKSGECSEGQISYRVLREFANLLEKNDHDPQR